MPSPFSGMDPYLENPALWTKVHQRLIVALADALSPHLRPKYIVDIAERVYQTTEENSLLVGIPDVAVKRSQTVNSSSTANIALATPPVQAATVIIPLPETVREWYLEVREVATRQVITAIEVLSPKNKRSKEGRKAYLKKRQRVFGNLTHLVEIDLLRAGEPMPILGSPIESDYRILVSRSERRPQAELYAFNLQHSIPSFLLPLQEEDTEPAIDLQTLINGVYDRAAYDLVIDYTREVAPPLEEENAAWVDALLREKGLR
ncbi:DUF4058 family protein [Microseira wollei]|uniref:DUF4058 family protein n=1 Tax=Microseira wollei NIES-4236 TaxID=2530354 RepID=A0AAV3X9T1_9CYAN|nr:DUF4058 family protein [Microseira wollei]GET38600.1 hypothetical protein MiSe_33580 [Microseira wollei NIES-4236]